MKFKRILCIFTSTFFISTFISCSNQKLITNQENKEIIIHFPTIWAGKDTKAKMTEEIIAQFNNENKGEILVITEPFEDYDTYNYKMRVNVAANTLPDIFTFKGGEEEKAYYRTNKLMDLTPYLDDNWKNNFITGSLEKVSYEGKTMSIPFELGVTPVIYNKNLLSQANISEFPKTYSEFFQMCDKLKSLGITPMSQMTGANAWTSMLWYSQLVTSIGGEDVYKNGLADPAFLEAAKLMKKMFSYTTNDAIGATAGQAGNNFLTQQTAIFMNGPWYISNIKNKASYNLYDYTDIAPAPYYEGGKGEPGAYIGFVQAYIGAAKQKDKNKEEAIIKFLKFFTSPENVKKMSIDSGALFVIKIDTNSGEKLETLQRKMFDQSVSAPYMIPNFLDSVKPSVAKKFPESLTKMVLNEITPEQFIEELISADIE